MAPLWCVVRGALVQDEFSVVTYEYDLGVLLLQLVVWSEMLLLVSRIQEVMEKPMSCPDVTVAQLSFAFGLWLLTWGAMQSAPCSPVEVLPWENSQPLKVGRVLFY